MKTYSKAGIPMAATFLLLVALLTACTSGPPSPAFGASARTGVAVGPAGESPTVARVPAAEPGVAAGTIPVEGAEAAGSETTPAGSASESPEGGAPGDAAVIEGDGGAEGELAETYRIHRGDIVSISVFREPSLNREVRVDADGTINLALVRQVYVQGMTKYEAEGAITATYGDGYLKNPIITVEIRPEGSSVAEGMVRILGEVRRPGLYPIPPGGTLSLLNALTSAGGLTDVARRNRIEITRISDDGKRQTFRANFDRIVNGSDPDFDLVPNDIISVPAGWW